MLWIPSSVQWKNWRVNWKSPNFRCVCIFSSAAVLTVKSQITYKYYVQNTICILPSPLPSWHWSGIIIPLLFIWNGWRTKIQFVPTYCAREPSLTQICPANAVAPLEHPRGRRESQGSPQVNWTFLPLWSLGVCQRQEGVDPSKGAQDAICSGMS